MINHVLAEAASWIVTPPDSTVQRENVAPLFSSATISIYVRLHSSSAPAVPPITVMVCGTGVHLAYTLVFLTYRVSASTVTVPSSDR